MKIITLFLILIYQQNVLAFTYYYKHKQEALTIEVPQKDFNEGLSEAAKKCMDFYTKGQGPSVGEEKWLDLIDVCVNPRTKPIN